MLRETEEVTLALLTEEAEAITGLFAPVARSADRLGRNVALGLNIATTLLGLLARSSSHPEHAEPRLLHRRVQAGEQPRPSTARVSDGTMMPSSHSRAVA